MDPEIEEFFIRFLAKNKYPVLKEQIDTLQTDFQSITKSPAEIETKKNKNAQDKFTLTLIYLGLNANEDLGRATYWLKQLPITFQSTLHAAILQVMIQIRSKQRNYRKFISEYHTLIERLPKMDFSNHKLFYRFLRLLSGWVSDFNELELAEDLINLSELIDDEEPNMMEIDKLINRWLSQGRKLELHLIRGILGETENNKLEYHLPTTLIKK